MANVKGANIESLRNINRIRLYRYKSKDIASTNKIYAQNNESLLFSAYSKDPVGQFTAGVATNSIMKGVMDAIFDPHRNIIGKIVTSGITNLLTQSMFGKASSNLQYDYNYIFTGLTEFSKTFNCYLQMKDDFFEDVATPLYNLLDFVLPKETETIEMQDWVQKVNAEASAAGKDAAEYITDKIQGISETKIVKGAQKLNKKIEDKLGVGRQGNRSGVQMLENGLQTIADWGFDIGKWIWKEANTMVGGISALIPPEQLDQKTALKLVIGDYIVLDHIFIDSVNFTIPFLTYEGGLFDHVDITLNIKGTRGVSFNTFDWVRKIATEGDKGFTSVEGKNSLNEMYAPVPKAIKDSTDTGTAITNDNPINNIPDDFV